MNKIVKLREAVLKARRTVLSKKSNQELINIVLRTEKINRKNAERISSLQTSNYDYIRKFDLYNNTIDELKNHVSELEYDITCKNDALTTKDENIANMNIAINREQESLRVMRSKYNDIKEKYNKVFRLNIILGMCLSFIIIGTITMICF